MNEIKYITLDDQTFELVDGAARAGLADKANRSEVPDVSEFITSADLPDLAPYALKTEIPAEPDLTDYAKKEDIPAAPDLSVYALKDEIPAEPDLTVYYTKSEIDNIIGDVDTVLEALGV